MLKMVGSCDRLFVMCFRVISYRVGSDRVSIYLYDIKMLNHSDLQSFGGLHAVPVWCNVFHLVLHSLKWLDLADLQTTLMIITNCSLQLFGWNKVGGEGDNIQYTLQHWLSKLEESFTLFGWFVLVFVAVAFATFENWDRTSVII